MCPETWVAIRDLEGGKLAWKTGWEIIKSLHDDEEEKFRGVPISPIERAREIACEGVRDFV